MKFLGRKLNPNTMVWEHSDKSGVSIPEELRIQMMSDLEDRPFGILGGNALIPLGRLFKYKEDFANKDKK